MHPVRTVAVAASLLVLGLLGSAGSARADPPTDEQRALERVLAALEAHPPVTARDFRVAFRELGLVGDSALPHLKALLRRYVDGPGFDDLEAHAFLGDRRFHHPIPEDVAFRGHPFLRTVEAANAQEWFRPDEERAWVAAHAALGATHLHHRRLLEDRRYRAGDQVFANVAMDPLFADQELRFTWADPYAVIEVGPPAPEEERAARIDTLRTIYRELLARYGEALGLRDLMEPWGGGPDAPAHVRSFPDGAPLTVFMYADPERLQELARWNPYTALPSARIAFWLTPSGVLHATGNERLAEAAAAQALRWFARQQRRWGSVLEGQDAISEGFAQWFAAHLDGPEAEAKRLEQMRGMERAFGERERAYPVFGLRELVAFSGLTEARRHAGSAWGISPYTAQELYRDQAWALVRMLQGARHREAFLAYLRAWLRGETQFGMARDVFRRTFHLAGDEEWAALDAEWQRTVREEILGEGASEAPVAPEAPAPERLHVKVRRTDDGTEVLVWSLLLAREVVPRARLPAEHEETMRRLLPVYLALDAVPPGPAGARPPVFLELEVQRGDRVPQEDLRLVLYALLVAGYEDIELDDALPPALRALLDAWNAAGAVR